VGCLQTAGVVQTTEQCTEADSEAFDLTITTAFLTGQLGDVCRSEAAAGNIGDAEDDDVKDGTEPEGDDTCSPAGSGSRRKLCMVG